MSIAKVKEYLRDYGRDCDVQEFPVSSATVELAAKALSVEPAGIANSLSVDGGETRGWVLSGTAVPRLSVPARSSSSLHRQRNGSMSARQKMYRPYKEYPG